MKLQEAIKSDKFRNARHMASLNVLYTAYWLRTNTTGILKDMGMTSEQFNVMRILRGKHPEPMCVRDIASRMLEKSSNVPRIIDRLVLKKLVKRTTSKEDKRETIINITAEGLKHLEQASKMVEKATDRLIGVTEEEAIQLHNLLEKLRTTD
jgi:DNA-binding MarR family transcriptional regulator